MLADKRKHIVRQLALRRIFISRMSKINEQLILEFKIPNFNFKFRCAKLVIEASVVCCQEAKCGFIRVSVASRNIMSKFDTKNL